LSQSHEWIKQASVAIEVDAQKVWNGQYRMPVDDSRYQTSTDEIDPIVSVGFGAREAKGRFAGHGDGVKVPTTQAAKPRVPHFLGIATVKHLVDDLIVV